VWLMKGITYGPLVDTPDGLPSEEVFRADLEKIVRLGCNTVRLYRPPRAEFLHACAEKGVQVLLGFDWPMNTDFLRERSGPREILRRARKIAREYRDFPAVLGFLVGNEVPATLVRWMTPARVQAFLEKMIRAMRQECPTHLYAYASYPSTEYLHPTNADFIGMNVYLEEREAYERYLWRLQHLGGDRPVVITEFGLDTLRHGGEKQAETHVWAWETGLQTGLAGHVAYAYTDQWFNGGESRTDWCFGVVETDRREKLAAIRLRGWLPSVQRASQSLRLKSWPRFSIVICTYGGARTLDEALRSTQGLPYPDYEVIVVDDGTPGDEIAQITARYREVRYERIPHAGLSTARNHGAQVATGEIIAYLDDDAEATEDWLHYLASIFSQPAYAAAGGPNVPPPPQTLSEALVIAAPGGPSHVLFNDREAEHLPGCNLAVRKSAWTEVGGFDARYWSAGDDVDFCWRLMERGHRLGFHPAAVVRHRRRSTVRAYLRQQRGYGRAEAMLIQAHADRFNRAGGARWRGFIYEPVQLAPSRRHHPASSRLYGGVFGHAPFQFVYTRPLAGWRVLVSGAGWWGVVTALIALALWWPWAWGLAVIALACPWIAVWPEWRQTQLPLGYRGRGPRLCLYGLMVWQGWARSWARWKQLLKERTRPQGPWPALGLRWPRFPHRKAVAEATYWSERGVTRDDLLAAVVDEMLRADWPCSVAGVFDAHDLTIEDGPIWRRWWRLQLTTVTEYHEFQQRLTRVRLASQATRLTIIVAVVLCVLVGLACWFSQALAIFLLALSFCAALAIEFFHGAQVQQLLRMTDYCARKLGLRHLDGSGAGKPGTTLPPSQTS
jgi:O-antigen biosynthesis protein